MKRITLLSACLLLACSTLFSQAEWMSFISNPNINTNVYDLEMYDGKIIQVYSQNNTGTDQLVVDMFNPVTMQWSTLDTYDTPLLSKVSTERINNVMYIVGYNGAAFKFFSFDDVLSNIVAHSPDYNEISVNNNWEFHASTNPNELYLLYSTGTGPSVVHGLEYISSSNLWVHYSENSTQDLSLAQFQITSTLNRVFFGYAGNNLRMTFFDKGEIGTSMTAYDGGATGFLLSDGNSWDNLGFLLLGNKNNYKSVYATEDAVNKSFEVEINEGTTIDINTSDPSTTFNLDIYNATKDAAGDFVYVFSNFSDDGLGNPNEKLKIIKKDVTQSSNPWESVGSNLIDNLGTFYDSHSLKMSVDNNLKHLVAGYTLSGSSTPNLKVLNSVPVVVSGTDVANTGLCPDQINELYSIIEISDADYDQVSILGAVSTGGGTSNITVIPLGFYNGISKFKIIGMPSSSTDAINLTLSDGYAVIGNTLGSYTATTPPLNVQFTSNPVKFCNNEQNIDLVQFVNYFDQGIFRLNGQNINGTEINSSYLNNIISSGTLRYIQNVNGCIVSAQTTYLFVDAPSVSITANPTTCTENTGQAVAVVTPGSSSNFSQYWSTGETTLTISNLSPGPYYFNVVDDNNCKATGLASITASDIGLTGNITHPTCSYSNNGSVDVNVTGTTNYQIVWSNGAFGNTLSNVSSGNYECTLYDESGCQIKKTYALVPPEPVNFDFTTTSPTCLLSNGSITTALTGGTSPYQSTSWNSGESTPSISNLSSGFYKLTVTDNNACVYSDSLYLNNLNSVEVLDSVFFADCNMTNGGINIEVEESVFSGPVNSYLWSNGASSQDIYGLSPGVYTVFINYGNNCTHSQAYEIGYKPPRRTDICVVTVHEETTTNLVVWEKDLYNDIQFYKIYRENTLAGTFQFVDTVNFNSISVFNDVIASPLQRSWRYRISGVNSCLVESSLSPVHKTLHLNTIEQVNPGTYNVYWDDYEGISDGTYIVHRFTDQNGWETLPNNVPFGETTMITDTAPVGATSVDYLVTFDLQTPCSATFKAESFERSRSNKNRGIFNPGEGAGDYPTNAGLEVISGIQTVKIYPNPFENEIVFDIQSEKSILVSIYDLTGKNIKTGEVLSGLSSWNTSTLQNGMYIVQVDLGKEKKIFKLEKR
ncbi:MAG: T9SS type A sorting domain-containing protein [Flavobacteriia bacterium]|nr:T9SS type A sorting domain-containing protein [Flavobacteriia bacterium]